MQLSLAHLADHATGYALLHASDTGLHCNPSMPINSLPMKSLPQVIERYLSKWAAAEGLVQGHHEIKRMTLAVIMQVGTPFGVCMLPPAAHRPATTVLDLQQQQGCRNKPYTSGGSARWQALTAFSQCTGLVLQVVLGRSLDEDALIELSDTFNEWQDGLFTLLPFGESS